MPWRAQRLVGDVGLREVAREAVEHVAPGRGGLGDDRREELDDDAVGHQLAAVDVARGAPADLGPARHLGAQRVAGGDVLEPAPLRQAHPLGALAAARAAEEEQPHARRVRHGANANRCAPPATIGA